MGELAKRFQRIININDAEKLLLEWLTWWEDEDTAPVKMPGALHIKTAIYFTEREYMYYAINAQSFRDSSK